MSRNLPGLDFSVRNIFGIGRNYPAHAKELNNSIPPEPIVFLKPTSALCFSGATIQLPKHCSRVDYEVEIVVAIGKRAKAVIEKDALNVVAGVGIGIDVTSRDLQEQAKEKGLPWAICKGFDTFAPLGPFIPIEKVAFPVAFELKINAEVRQNGDSSQMLFSIPKIITFLSSVFTLEQGDLVFTGTPSGVGPLKPGDRLEATLGQGLSVLKVGVGQ